MLDHQRIVDDLRSAMYSATPESLDMLRLAAADYSVACDETNARLRQCDALLRQGLRSEAIQLCEVEPNLLDVVACLDYPERDQLLAIIGQAGLAPPPELSVDVAAELNEAYAMQAPLESLLRQHRLLALAHGPLQQRIKTLRSICEVDRGTLVWIDDLKSFEKERLKDMQREAEQAAKAGNLVTLAALAEEVQDTRWRYPPPSELVNRIRQAADKLRRYQARKDLEGVEAQLNEAFAAFDVDTGRRLRERWHALVASCGLRDDDPLAERAAPALQWLREQDEQSARIDEYNGAVGALESAVAYGQSTISKLEQLYRAATGYGEELPLGLEHRYRTKVKKLQVQSQRRKIAILGSIATAVMAIVVATSMVIWSNHRAKAREASASKLSQLITDGRLSAAQRYLEELSATAPAIAHSSEIRELSLRLEGLLKEEQSRKDQFEHAMERVRQAGYETPDFDALKRAENVAKTAEEKSQVADARADIAKIQRESLAERGQKFQVDVDRLSADLDQLEANLEKDGPDGAPELTQRFRELRAEIVALRGRGDKVAPEVRKQAEPLTARLTGLERVVEGHDKEQTALAHIDSAIGDLQRYRSSLQEYVKQFPDSPRTTDLSKVVEELPLIEGVLRWNDFAIALRQADSQGTTPTAAKPLVAEAKKLMQDLGKYPQAHELGQFLPQLQYLARRIGEDGPIQKELVALFQDKLVSGVRIVEDINGRRWYLKNAPESNSDGGIQFAYISGFDLSTKPMTLTRNELGQEVRAPQSIVAEKVLAELFELEKSRRAGAWEQHFAKILAAIYDQDFMEPILKVALLKRVVPVACDGSASLSRALSGQRDALEKSAVNTLAPWMVPNSDKENQKIVKEARDLAVEELRAIAGLTSAAGKVAKESPKPIHIDEYRWIGSLRKDKKGAWTCPLRLAGDASQDLYVAEQIGSQGTVALSLVGRINDGKAEIDKFKPSLLREGRAVFSRNNSDNERPKTATTR